MIMLGYERKEPFVIKGGYAECLLNTLERMRTGNYNQEDLEQIHYDNVTPEWEIVDGDNPDAISNMCRVCDLHRNNSCEGKHEHCDKFQNCYNTETCQFCKFAESTEDTRHIFCPKKNEKMNIKRWCINFEKK